MKDCQTCLQGQSLQYHGTGQDIRRTYDSAFVQKMILGEGIMGYGTRLFLTSVLSFILLMTLILQALQDGITDILGFLIRNYFSSTLAVSVLLLNTWLSYLNYRQGVDYLEGFWKVEMPVKGWRGDKEKRVKADGQMYLVRTKAPNVFHGYMILSYTNNSGERMFVGTYDVRMTLQMNWLWSRKGTVDGRTFLKCRQPGTESDHDAFVRPNIQTLTFDKTKRSLQGQSRFKGEKEFGDFSAIKESP